MSLSLCTRFHVAYPNDNEGCPRHDLIFSRPCRDAAEARRIAATYNEDPSKAGIIYQFVSPRGEVYPVFQLRNARCADGACESLTTSRSARAA